MKCAVQCKPVGLQRRITSCDGIGSTPLGPASKHIQQSHGADIDLMKFYITQNSSTYGRHWQNFRPRMGRHAGTGFTSNHRPQLYYTAKMDEVDNPTMGRICKRNYHTITELSYQPYEENDGKEPFPNSCHQTLSGFTRPKAVHHPSKREAHSVFIDTRVANATTDVLPSGKPLLHKIQGKRPIDEENYGYGPSFMSTETKTRFKGKQAPHDHDLNYMSVGPPTESGFTHNDNIENVTFYPKNPHIGDQPGWHTYRPTGISITKTSYRPLISGARGEDVNPGITVRSDRGSGWTHDKVKAGYQMKNPDDVYDKASDVPALRTEHTKKNDPMEYLNMAHPNTYETTYKGMYQGKTQPDLTLSDKLNRTKMGYQELSGHCTNNDRFVRVLDDPRRFITHYMTRFQDRNPQGIFREGHLRGGVQRPRNDGFTNSTSLHDFGPDIDTTNDLRTMEPYQARSIKARDEFYDDHTYDHKSELKRQGLGARAGMGGNQSQATDSRLCVPANPDILV